MNLADMTLAEALAACPGLEEKLCATGLEAALNEQGRRFVAPYVRLSTLLRSRGIDPAAFEAGLAAGDEGRRELSLPGERVRLNFLALMPCPLKMPFERALAAHLASSPEAQDFTWCVEGNANLQTTYYDLVPHFADADELPDLIISPGVNVFFGDDFRRRFVDTGLFTDVTPDAVNADFARDFAETPYKDPAGSYSMLAMNLLVFLVDEARLGGRPAPRRFADLLEPEMEDLVAVRGQKGFYCETMLMTVYREFGMDGVRRLARSVLCGLHPAEMVKMAGKGRADAPAVSVLPYFFARSVPREGSVRVVWPEDGALVSPVTLLAKREAVARFPGIASFLAGPEVARIFSGALFPALHPDVPTNLPETPAGSRRLKWLGWDFLAARDPEVLTRELTEAFIAARPGKRP
ncbi:ABC-type Fe3+ transport system periplasmic component-like protein [Desulfovibrio sp. X2]|uniref:ABC transporter substrate-binding protein n=1 Tax=Desulfovibrio sp. X2 TaxID=941449 RepID=UPI0003588D82|nr:ABC transporter substrate-binding protein [Desulfovibrio sp. X2]EPR37026.1 ABC-type Fe3+ transport system periplasmic component-like protein [Desulfovibrio sp. X2]